MTMHYHRFDSAETSGRTIVEALGGHWTPRGGLCRCPAHADRSPSLSVRPGRRRLLFHCFAGCSTVEVMAALRRLHLPSAVGWADRVPAPSDELGRERARRLWSEARPAAGTIVGRYLAGRGLGVSSSLRFHPRTPQGRAPLTRFAPAMIAAVEDETGIVAVHRTFLRLDGAGLSKRQPVKAALGPLGSGFVRLAPPGAVLGLAEGIETALSAQQMFGVPCWATLGGERFRRVALPAGITEIILFLDHDSAGRCAEAVARERFGDRRIEVRYPEQPGTDWNDVLSRRTKQPVADVA